MYTVGERDRSDDDDVNCLTTGVRPRRDCNYQWEPGGNTGPKVTPGSALGHLLFASVPNLASRLLLARFGRDCYLREHFPTVDFSSIQRPPRGPKFIRNSTTRSYVRRLVEAFKMFFKNAIHACKMQQKEERIFGIKKVARVVTVLPMRRKQNYSSSICKTPVFSFFFVSHNWD